MSLDAFVPNSFRERVAIQQRANSLAWDQGQGMDARTLANLTSIKRNYDWISSGVALSLAQSGYSGVEPQLNAIGKLEMKRQLRDQQFNELMTSNPSFNDLSHLSKREFHNFTKKQREAIRQVGNQQLSEALDEGGGIDLGYTASRMVSGDIGGAVLGGGFETQTQFDNPAHKSMIREAGVVANSAMQVPLAGVRSVADQAQRSGNVLLWESGLGGSPPNATNQVTPTDVGGFVLGNPQTKESEFLATEVGQQVQAGIEGEDPWATGKGLLPDFNSPIGRGQAEAARAQGANIAGHAFTLGRFAAQAAYELTDHHYIDPDSNAWNLMSGLIDATVTAKLDPANALIGASSEARAARKFWSPVAAERPLAYRGTDLIDNAMRTVPRFTDDELTAARAAADAGVESTVGAASIPEFTTSRYGRPAKEWDAMYENDRGGFFDEVRRIHGDEVADAVVADHAGRMTNSEVWNLYEETGMMMGDNPHLRGPKAVEWANDKRRDGLFKRLGEDLNSPYDVYIASKRKFTMETSAAFARTKNADEARLVFMDQLNAPGLTGPFNIPQPTNIGYQLRMGFRHDSIMGGMFPEVKFLQPYNGDETLRALDDLRQGAHLTMDEVRPIMDKFMQNIGSAVPGADLDSRLQAINAMGDLIEARMLKVGTDPVKAKEITKFLHTDIKSIFKAMDSFVADQSALPFNLVIGSEIHPYPDMTALSKMVNTAMELPEPKVLRNATSNASKLLNHPIYRGTVGTMDAFMQNIFKPLALLRPALILRIVGDSQASLFAGGWDSLFNHPINYIGMMVGQEHDRVLARAWQKMGIEPSYVLNGMGEPLIKSANIDLMHQLYGGMDALSPAKASMYKKTMVDMNSPLAPEGTVQTIQRLRQHPLVEAIANQPDRAAARAWFWDGEGSYLREEMVRPTERLAQQQLTYGELADQSDIIMDLTTQKGADAFVDKIINRISEVTGDHPDFIEAVRTGKIRNVPLWGKSNKFNKHAVNQARDVISEELARMPYPAEESFTTLLPSIPRQPKATRTQFVSDEFVAGVKAQKVVERGPRLPKSIPVDDKPVLSGGQEFKKMKDNALETMFFHMLTDPDVDVSRVPAFKQSLWGTARKGGAIERIAPYLSVDDYKKLIQNVEKNNLPGEVLHRLQNIQLDAQAPRIPLSIAMQQAEADAMSRIVYMVDDLHARSQFGDMTRILFPFGDAFRRVLQRWTTVVYRNPESLRKLQIGMQAARQSGFFHKDPQTGEEVFTYPGSTWLTEQLIDVPVELHGRVKGLSMVGSGLPGFGPAVTWPTQWLLPDVPRYDNIRKIIFPMGEAPETGNVLSDITSTVYPRWAKSIIDGPPDTKSYNDAVGAMMNYLASTGEYQLRGKDAVREGRRLMSDAKSKARWFYFIKGAAQFGAPTSPTQDFQIRDKTGHLQVLKVVKDDYYKKSKELGPEGAMQWLLEEYGPDNLFIAQPTSVPTGYAVPVTKAAWDWVRDNPEMKGKYPTTYGFLAPYKPDAEFDITAYGPQFRGDTPARRSLSPEEQQRLANSRVGLHLFHRERDKMIRWNGGNPLTKFQSQMLADYKLELQDRYPGFNLVPYDTTRLPRAVDELQRAIKDPQVRSTEAGKGLIAYFAARKEAMDTAVAMGLSSPFRAKSAVILRDGLREEGIRLSKLYPSFQPMWEQIWMHEMADDGEI